ncbi:L-lysine 6-transaminase [Sphingobacteriaceae bacterium]|nr:L-lysine 6-transaminase [Sphingobacteriaceae bacterium]
MFNSLSPSEVLPVMKEHILADGYRMVLDLEKSQGSYIYDSLNKRKVLDLFSYFGTNALGHNHPKMKEDLEFLKDLQLAAVENPSNSDFYTTQYANFMATFARLAMPKPFVHAFFISGGTLAVENGLKVAMDWKGKKNAKKGVKGEKGTQIIHFKQAFHGRSGYCLSLTNTKAEHIDGFAKFNWPRIVNPKLSFPITENALQEAKEKEEEAVQQIYKALKDNPDDVCAIIIEPIQSEGGDNHFRKEFLQSLRKICDENEILLIFDEVQNGVGLSGKFWAYQNFDVTPDILCFGKKMQTCGIIATSRIDEVEDNCFKIKGRINSTWGGNLADMVRATKILRIMEEDKLVENAAKQGKYILEKMIQLSKNCKVSNTRGLGLQCAMDLPTKELRDKLLEVALKNNLLLLSAGEKSIRFRPMLTVTKEIIDEAFVILERSLKEIDL